MGPSAKHPGIELQSRIAGTPLTRGAPSQLSQAVMNLTLNAMDAAARRKAASGGQAYVRVELNETDGHTELIVADSGDGPADAVADKLFEQFVTDKPEGIGLGLSVARRVVESYGGELCWRREATETRFVMTLPVAGNGETDGKPTGD